MVFFSYTDDRSRLEKEIFMNLAQGKRILDQIAQEQHLTLKEKNFRIAGVITEYVKAKIGVRLITVGGLAVEIYTEGGYMTRDIDFVGEDHSSIMRCLEELGFEPTWKYKKNILGGEVMRFHNKLNTLVEVPSETLKGASPIRAQKLKTVDGLEDV